MAFILLTLLIDILAIGIIIPVLPALVKEFVGGDESLAGWYYGVIGASYSLMQFFFAPILGALSDRFGRRPVLLASLFGLGIDFIITALAPTIAWLFLARLIAGIMGASISTCNAYIADISTDENRARNFGLVGVMFGLGFIIGPALGGFLGEYNLRWPFFAAAGLSLINWLYGFFILPESLPPEKRSAFQLQSINPLGSVRRLRKYPMVAGLAVAFVFSSLAQRGLENVWILSMEFRFGWNEFTNGMILALVGLMAMVVQGGLVRPAIRRFGERNIAIFATAVSVLSFMGYGLATAGWMIPCIIIVGSLSGLSGPAIQSLVTGTVDPTEQGRIQGSLTSLISLTNIAAPLIFTTGLFSYFTSERVSFEYFGKPFAGAPFVFGSFLLMLSLSALVVVLRRYPRVAQDAEERSSVVAAGPSTSQED